MNYPLSKKKEEYKDIIEKISLQNSPVGIDAQYTHAIIIDFLRQISDRLEKIEKTVYGQQTVVIKEKNKI